MIVELLVMEDFKQWLLKKAPDEAVGRPSHCELCPMANFLKQRIEEEGYEVSKLELVISWLAYCDGDWEYDKATIREKMPQWAIRFYHEVHHHTMATASDCIHALWRIDNDY